MTRLLAPPLRPFPTHRAALSPSPLAALWRDVVGSWRHALARAQQVSVDDDTLRDLGLGRGELASYRAEADGLVEATRLRVLQQRQSDL